MTPRPQLLCAFVLSLGAHIALAQRISTPELPEPSGGESRAVKIFFGSAEAGALSGWQQRPAEPDIPTLHFGDGSGVRNRTFETTVEFRPASPEQVHAPSPVDGPHSIQVTLAPTMSGSKPPEWQNHIIRDVEPIRMESPAPESDEGLKAPKAFPEPDWKPRTIHLVQSLAPAPELSGADTPDSHRRPNSSSAPAMLAHLTQASAPPNSAPVASRQLAIRPARESAPSAFSHSDVLPQAAARVRFTPIAGAGVDIAKPGQPYSRQATFDRAKKFEALLVEYGRTVRAELRRRIRYPRAAKDRDLQGTVTLTITLSRKGALIDYSVHRSSGFRLLDQAAIAAAQRARFPEAPALLPDATLAFRVPLAFRLQ